LPYLPQTIGVITSPTGAVIRDILHRFEGPFPPPRHRLARAGTGRDCRGRGRERLAGFNAMAEKPDLLIVARGGGSLEDLWPFNDEAIVRAVAASAIPVISAIGHETDTTLIDHVADWRAPDTNGCGRKGRSGAGRTASRNSLRLRPASSGAMLRVLEERKLRLQSAARALPTPDDVVAIVRQKLDNLAQRLPGSLTFNLQRHAVALAGQLGKLSPRLLQQRLVDHQRRVLDAGHRANRALRLNLKHKKDRFGAETKLFQSLGYRSVLARGYALVRGRDNQPIRSSAIVKPGTHLRIEFSDGTLDATADKPPKMPGQGSLF
jgi:exodeoxyribonuclease VII large subunit